MEIGDYGELRLLRLGVDHLVVLHAVVRRPDGREPQRGHEIGVHCDGECDKVGERSRPSRDLKRTLCGLLLAFGASL